LPLLGYLPIPKAQFRMCERTSITIDIGLYNGSLFFDSDELLGFRSAAGVVIAFNQLRNELVLRVEVVEG
jgi:hypothetical protein